MCGWMCVTEVVAAGEMLLMAACFSLFQIYFLTPGPRGHTRSDGINGGSAGMIKASRDQLDRQRKKGQKDPKRIPPCNKKHGSVLKCIDFEDGLYKWWTLHFLFTFLLVSSCPTSEDS